MICNINIQRDALEYPQDSNEKWGNLLLTPYHQLFGKVYTLTDEKIEKKSIASINRIGCAILFLFAFPLIAAVTLVGVCLHAKSKSYQKINKIFLDRSLELKPAANNQNLKDKIYYFSYGSNMLQSRLEERVGKVKLVGSAVLKNYEFKFSKYSAKDRSGKANIHPQQGKQVEGAVFLLTRSQLTKLDVFEGVQKQHYQRVTLNVSSKKSRKQIKVETYIAMHPKFLKENLKPTVEYKNFIMEGAKKVGLSKSAIENIKKEAGF